MRKLLLARRVWPPPKYPLFREAMDIYTTRGKEGFEVWAASLSDSQVSAFADEIKNFLEEIHIQINKENQE